MGEVFLAKISGAAGFEKPCIVKTVLPALLKDSQFLDRFHHEAKVLVHLVHSSIAQVYDMGEAENTYYMALEYVAGVDLAYLLEQARVQGRAIPVPVALYLGQRIAEGLGYAHRKTSTDGSPLGIVHRDVSPHNVMVSYEGEVKVIDFGLAKSAARSKYTLPATVMGKLGYMSPEQVRAEPVDHHSDIYSCGVVVWELLAGQSLIAHGTVAEMMAAMSQPSVPLLSGLREDVDPALDAVVRRALAPSPEERYARADEFARALNEHFLRTSSAVGAEEVGNFVRDLCPHAFAAQRELIGRLTSSSTRRTPLPAAVVVPLHTGLQFAPTSPSAEPPMPASGHTGFADTVMRPPSPEPLMSQGPSRKGWAIAISLGVLGLVGATAGTTAVLMSSRRPPPRAFAEARPLPPPPPLIGFEAPRAPPPTPPVLPSEPAAPQPEPATSPAKSSPAPRSTPGAQPENLVAIRSVGSSHIVSRGRLAGLVPGMTLQVVEAPSRDGKTKVLGEATVLDVFPRRAALQLDDRARGSVKSALFVVLPSRAAHHGTSPDRTPAPAEPETPAQLNGRIAIKMLGPLPLKISLTNTDTVPWSGCKLVIRGREVFELGEMEAGGTRDIALSEFQKGGRDVPFVTRNRLGLFCTEGEKEFPAKL